MFYGAILLSSSTGAATSNLGYCQIIVKHCDTRRVRSSATKECVIPPIPDPVPMPNKAINLPPGTAKARERQNGEWEWVLQGGGGWTGVDQAQDRATRII